MDKMRPYVYYLKKILSMIITLFVVAFLVFAAFEIIPGDVATSMLGSEATPQKVAALKERLGLDKPFLTRFFTWLISFVKGDLGVSYTYSMPVSQVIASKLPITAVMSLMAFLITVVVSVPLGVFMAKHKNSRADKCLFMTNQVIMAIPSFFLGILITYVFGLVLKLFKPGGYISYTQDVAGFISYLIFPAIAIALPKIAMCVKLLRNSILMEGKKDYIRTAYSRGLSTTEVLYRHALRNAIMPVITFLGMTLTDMIAGSIVIEQVFNIPGLGRILLTSISRRDYPIVEAIILIIATTVLIVNFIVDILQRIIDPRTRDKSEN